MDIKETQLDEHSIKNGDSTEMSTTVLGLLIGDDRYLVHMKEINEVIQVPEIAPVPLTHPWFLGIINVHGNLYGITDLGVYLSGKTEPFGLKSRILLVSSSYKINSGFIVPNLLGIRNMCEFERDQTAGVELRNGVTHIFRDKEGRPWYGLDLRTLIREKNFLQIAR